LRRHRRSEPDNPWDGGPVATAARQESIIDMFAIGEAMGECVYRFAPIAQL
jgi:hypothetical protein